VFSVRLYYVHELQASKGENIAALVRAFQTKLFRGLAGRTAGSTIVSFGHTDSR